jgi:hypothetical protein
MGTLNKNCGGATPKSTNSAFVILILFILMAIVIGGRFF